MQVHAVTKYLFAKEHFTDLKAKTKKQKQKTTTKNQQRNKQKVKNITLQQIRLLSSYSDARNAGCQIVNQLTFRFTHTHKH